jgi:carbon monoxide dehydrogenase subunit G
LVRIEKSIEIKASPEKVWEMLALDRLPEWDEGYKENLKSVEYTSEVRKPKDKSRVGATAHGIPKKKGEYNFEITESLENEKMTYGMKGGGFKGLTVTSILEPVGDGTKFTFVIDAELPWGILGKGLGKLMRGMGEKDAEKSLERLKNILEK